MEYSEYITLMNRQINNNDVREIVFQENVIRHFLKRLLPKWDIEPVDTKIPTKIHNYRAYCGTYTKNYKDGSTKELPATPDLCITAKWNWINENLDYKGVVEVKSPALDHITGLAIDKYKCLDEIKRHLSAIDNDKVILTDGVTWVFYCKSNKMDNQSNPIPIIEPICLGELIFKRKNNGRKNAGLERTESGKPIIEKIDWISDSTKFDDLKKELKDFLRYYN